MPGDLLKITGCIVVVEYGHVDEMGKDKADPGVSHTALQGTKLVEDIFLGILKTEEGYVGNT